MRKDDTGEAKQVVEPEDSARQLVVSAEDDFPDVFSTSRMVALMETAAARAMRDELGDGQLSIGVDVRIRHLAATPIGAEVYARAMFLGMRGQIVPVSRACIRRRWSHRRRGAHPRGSDDRTINERRTHASAPDGLVAGATSGEYRWLRHCSFSKRQHGCGTPCGASAGRQMTCVFRVPWPAGRSLMRC